jgi:hypothetical protein
MLTNNGANLVDTPEPQPVSPPFQRRWYQYSLRSLMIFVMVCGVLLGWGGSFYRRVHNQRRAVARASALGGFVRYDYQYRNGWPDANATPPGPGWVRAMLGDDAFANVETIQFGNKESLRDTDLETLEGLRDLRVLRAYPKTRNRVNAYEFM